ncbi:hypothetical protein FACS1894158_09450 [Betaproteobacteria bacterium]|nr:hypothetical protein FACS1894158_09450 [Betaproteobacteria bacterium]
MRRALVQADAPRQFRHAKTALLRRKGFDDIQHPFDGLHPGSFIFVVWPRSVYFVIRHDQTLRLGRNPFYVTSDGKAGFLSLQPKIA